MPEGSRGFTRREFAERMAMAGAALALAPLIVGFPSESAGAQTPEKKPLTQKELTEKLLCLNNRTNRFEDRQDIAEAMGSTPKIAELVNRNGLISFMLGIGSEQNGSYLNEIVVKINKIPDGSFARQTEGNIATDSAQVKYEVMLGPSLAPPVWAEMLFADNPPDPRGFANRRVVSKETLLDILERVSEDNECGKILGANFGESSTFGLRCESEQVDPRTVESYDHMLSVLSGPNFTQTGFVRPYRGSDYVSTHDGTHASPTDQTEIRNVAVLINGRLPQMAPFSGFKAVHEIDARPQYIANSTRIGLETHGFGKQFVQLTLDHGGTAVVQTSRRDTYLDTSKTVPHRPYTVFAYDLTRAAVSAFNSPARPSGELA